MNRFFGWILRALPLALPFYLVRFSIGPLPTTLLELFLFVLIVLYTYQYRFEGWKQAWNKAKGIRWYLLAFSVASLAACFWSPSVMAGLGLWRAYVLEPVILFFLVLDCLDRDISRRALSLSMYWSVVVVGVWGVIEYLTGYGIPKPWNVAIDAGRRATGPFPYPNALALYCVPIGTYALAMWREKRERWFALVTYLVSVIVCFVAKSDGGLIALMVVTWVILFSIKRLRITLIAATIFGLVAVFSVPTVRAPIVKELTFKNWSGYVRKKMWEDTWRMLKDHPVKGAGMAGYPTAFKPYQTTTGIEVFQYPHNIILNVWVEMGLAGLLAFVLIYLSTLWKTYQTRFLGGFVVLVAVGVHGLVDVPYFKNDLAILFYLFLVLIWHAPSVRAFSLASDQKQSLQENHLNG